MIRQLLADCNGMEKIAVIDGQKNVTRRELVQKALAIGQCFPTPKVETIAIFLPNSSDYIAALFSAFYFGMTALPLSIQMTIHEVTPLLKQVSVDTVITSKQYTQMMEEIKRNDIPLLCVIYVEDLQPMEPVVWPETVSVKEEEPMILLATSGTTGDAKIVQLSEANVTACVLGYLDKMKFKEKPDEPIRYTIGSPFSSAYAIMILCACLIKAFPVVLLKDGLTLTSFFEAVQTHRITHYEGGSLVVQLMERTLDRRMDYDISSLNYIGFGGSKVPADTVRSLLQVYPQVEFWQGYGMTEAGPLITKHNRVKLSKFDSSGTAIKGMTVAIETDGAIATTPHVIGEIVAKGPSIMLGYYKNKAETDKVLKNGYLYTGDIGYLDEEGHLYICGRKKNVIIVRGLNVHPEEVEACILGSSMVKDCIVYGEKSVLENETVCADVVAANPQVRAQEIGAYCEAHLAAYKRPTKINMVPEIKKTATGKNERKAPEHS